MIKHIISFFTCIWCAFLMAREVDPDFEQALIKGARLQMKLKVMDDNGVPISGASVHVLMGMNFRLKSYDIDGNTDANGVFVVEGRTTGNEIEITVKKQGFYKEGRRICLFSSGKKIYVKDGRWQPWGMELEIRMGKVRNPVQLVGFLDGISVPAIGTWVGFDMKEKDWVYAGHRGRTSDFEVNFRWDGKPFDLSELLEMDVRFTEKYSGYYLTKPSRSSFRGVYSASTNESYRQSLVCNIKERGSSARMGFEHPLRMVIRSRCIVDESENLVSSNYSTIGALVIEGGWKTNGIVNLSYLFNPRPNDTNLEPKR